MATLTLKAGDSSAVIEIGTEIQTTGANLAVHAGGDEVITQAAQYEADKGFVIVQATPMIVSQWGNASYTTSLSARDSNFEKTEKIFTSLEELLNTAAEKGQEKNALMINWVRKQVLDYYFKQTSTNARFEVSVTCQSYTIRTPAVWPFGPGAIIDTKTANLELYFSFKLIKLITPEELSLVQEFFEKSIAANALVEFQYK